MDPQCEVNSCRLYGFIFLISEGNEPLLGNSKEFLRKVENAGLGSRGAESRGLLNTGPGGKRGVRWKMRGLVENAGSGGKRGVWWKTRGLVENAGSNVENTRYH